MELSDQVKSAFEKHVLQTFPAEACGVVVKDQFLPCVNVAEDPKLSFRIDAVELGKIEAEHGELQAVLHSHPYNKNRPPKWPAEWPSSHDMESWMQASTPWAICSTDGEGISQLVWMDESRIEPLKGRDFIHGINDCYSIIRDWFKRERGITLMNFPRDMEWWEQGRDLYSENFEHAGFIEIDPKQAGIGDAVLFKVASPVINHAAVITGPNLILHHLFHRASGEQPLSKWQRHAVKFVRYVGKH
jgi:proteasome lid subunit RPN8/RPN11